MYATFLRLFTESDQDQNQEQLTFGVAVEYHLDASPVPENPENVSHMIKLCSISFRKQALPETCVACWPAELIYFTEVKHIHAQTDWFLLPMHLKQSFWQRHHYGGSCTLRWTLRWQTMPFNILHGHI